MVQKMPHRLSIFKGGYSEFLDPLLQTLSEEHQFQLSRVTNAGNGFLLATCHDRHIKYEARLAQGKVAIIALHFDNKGRDRNIRLVKELSKYRGEIEDKLGYSLQWCQEKDTERRRIQITRKGDIDVDAHKLDEIREWMIKSLIELRKVFDPYLRSISEG